MTELYIEWWSSLDNYWKLKLAQAHISNWTHKQSIQLKANYDLEEIKKIALSVKELKFFDENEKMTNVPDLSLLKNLVEFHIGSKCEFDNIENIKTIQNLEYLSIFNSEIDNIDFVSSLHNLKRLELFTTKVSSFECLANLMNLEQLRFSKHYSDTETRVNDLSPLSNLKNLKILNINQDIINLKPLTNLTNLEEFSFVQIESFEYLKDLKKLKKIYVMGNQNKYNLSELSPISNLNNLEHLDISFSNTSDLSSINNLNHLKLFVYKDTPLDEEHKNFWKKLFGKTEIQRFKKMNPNCELRNYK